MRTIMIRNATLFLLTGFLLLGCAPGRSMGTPDPQLALRLKDEASKLQAESPQEAKALLLRAIEADPYCGPALNNLGVLYLREGNRERAADTLEQARRNMPQDPRPYVNLALLFAKAHQYEEATSFCGEALELRPEYLPAIQLKTWLQIRMEETDESTLADLERIAIYATDPDWRRFGEEYAMKLRGEQAAAEAGEIGN